MKQSKEQFRYPILVVEDNRVSRQFLEVTLKHAGYKVAVAENGRQAMDILAKRHYPMIITDWNMPEMNGVELCRAIRTTPRPGYVYILLLTAREGSEDIIDGLEAGADEYLKKPFQKEELLARLHTGLRFLEMESSLKRAKEYAESVLGSMVDAVFVLSTEQVIRRVNTAACNLLGYSEKELTGKVMSTFIAEDPEIIETQCEEVKRTGRVEGRELMVRTRRGDTIPVNFNSSVFFASPKRGMQPAGVICVARDISERIKAESRLKNAMQELETTQGMLIQSEKLASIGQLAAGVAHEILNPTNIVSIRLQLLEKTETLSPKSREVLAICKQQLQRIVEITKDLGRFTRASAKSVQLTDINTVVKATMNLYAPQLRLEDVRWKTDLPEGLPPVLIDRKLVEEVLLNLLSNAAAAMKGKTEKIIAISTGVCPESDCVRLRVSDVGTGIPPESLNKIFDPYFSTKPPEEGTGLGLFLSYGIVKDQGGNLWAENNPDGPGATFFMEFPVTHKPLEKIMTAA
ncbi:MAG: response regulator [Pseudomonadota bacterium]